MIHLSIDIKPIPKARPRFTRNGHTYTPATTLKFESHIRQFAKARTTRPLEGALEVDLKFNFLKAKTSKLTAHTKRPDLDNLIKGVLDALNGVGFVDDAQIVKLTAEKNFSDRDFIEITINELI